MIFRKERTTYKQRIYCMNCEKFMWIDIPKGTPRPTSFERMVCANCGCKEAW